MASAGFGRSNSGFQVGINHGPIHLHQGKFIKTSRADNVKLNAVSYLERQNPSASPSTMNDPEEEFRRILKARYSRGWCLNCGSDEHWMADCDEVCGKCICNVPKEDKNDLTLS